MPQPRRVIFDVLYGFIPITEWEEAIINSPFFQRLRWIKQLGFANYIFPGAEHNRFAHAIGVMHSMQQMLEVLGLAVPEVDLHSPKTTNREAMLHKCLRISALLHDIGTFPFSHSIEFAYIRHGNDHRGRTPGMKNLPNSHEHLGSFIIKNTNYEGGITRILEQYGLDVELISKIIKGDSPYLVANQLMHSDLDADRMDYLIRDSHHTGIQYGRFDRDYLLSSLVTFKAGANQVGFGVREGAIHAIEDFLVARYHWYSQVVKNPGSAKFDIMATHLAKALLEHDLIFQFHDLLSMIENRGERFFWWNDTYFITRCQEIKYSQLLKDPNAAELIEMILYRRSPKEIVSPLFSPKILDAATGEVQKKKWIRHIESEIEIFESTINRFGSGREWILFDIPQKDVVFSSRPRAKKGSHHSLTERDPIKVVTREGTPVLLQDVKHSLMSLLSGFSNFVPSVYANESAFQLLKKKKLI